MLENERIIVQDRGGIDAGIAALMQNANKGFDPAALMAMMNNGNGMFGGNGGWWWIFIIVLFWMWGGWGGNGFGRGNQAETNSDFARLAAMGNQNNNTDLLMQAINGNKDAINTLSTNLNCDVKSIDNALCSIQNAIGKVGGEVGFSAERVINAEPEVGFDALNERYVNMIEVGIVDPTKVTRSALQNAASIAGVFLTTEAAVADLPEAEPAMPGMGGGMPGMM